MNALSEALNEKSDKTRAEIAAMDTKLVKYYSCIFEQVVVQNCRKSRGRDVKCCYQKNIPRTEQEVWPRFKLVFSESKSPSHYHGNIGKEEICGSGACIRHIPETIDSNFMIFKQGEKSIHI